MGPRVDVVAPLNEQLTGSSGDRTNTSNYQPIGARLDSPTSNGHQTNTQVEATTASNDQQAVILADASAPNERLVDFLPNTPTNTDLVLPPNQHTNSGVDDVPPAQATDFMEDLANIAETFTTLASLPSPLVSENPLNISNNEDTVPLNRDVGQLVPNLSDKNHAVDSMIPSGTTVEKGNAMDTTTTPNTSTINQATVSTPNVDTANNENPAAPGSAQDSPTSNTSNTTSNTYPKPTTPSSIPAKDPVNKFAMFVTSLLPSAQNSGRVLSLSTGSRDVPICLDSDDDDD